MRLLFITAKENNMFKKIIIASILLSLSSFAIAETTHLVVAPVPSSSQDWLYKSATVTIGNQSPIDVGNGVKIEAEVGALISLNVETWFPKNPPLDQSCLNKRVAEAKKLQFTF